MIRVGYWLSQLHTNFRRERIKDIPPNSVLEIITPSLCFEADDDYILDEDVYSRLTSLLQTDTITVTEKIHELFEQEETVIMSCQKMRRGRIVNKPRHLQDFY
jgi:hypothetical protein